MNLDAIKRAPKWTWFIAGGVGLGVIAIRVYQGRDAEDGEANAGDGTTAGDATAGTTYPSTTGGSPPGVIVPPIITGGDGGSASDLGAAFAGLVGGTITDLTGLVGQSIDANTITTTTWISALSQDRDAWINALAAAGSRPEPVAQNPTPVIVNVAAPPAAPVAQAPATAAKPKPPNPEYPFLQDTGPRKGQWYKVVLKDGKRYNYYANGDKVLA